MVHPTKIATCCHCGTRAALVLDRGRHHLRCEGCGAPLTALKSVRPEGADRPKAVDHRPVPKGSKSKRKKESRPAAYYSKPRKKPRKGLLRRFAEEAFDLVEDIFD